jgi:hypothetical protein
MTETSQPPADWIEAVRRAGGELHLGTDLARPGPADWARICGRAGQILADQGHPVPPDWEAALARALGRPDPDHLAPDHLAPDHLAPDDLARDEADAVLAAQGEVFAREDDA